jgi:hypothetical protein
VDMFPRTSHVETVALFQQLSLPNGKWYYFVAVLFVKEST